MFDQLDYSQYYSQRVRPCEPEFSEARECVNNAPQTVTKFPRKSCEGFTTLIRQPTGFDENIVNLLARPNGRV